ncbi:MAG: oligosaccharide flippase family protein [Candidatus Marinimicrobia bacterium]|nr:oligosaccharide flippase family protein [Candidatus Neomarinimicrobiota bacterium]
MISKRLLLKETILYGVSKAIPGAVGLGFVMVFIRLIGPSEYGQYSLLLSQCNLIVAISFGWLNQAQLRYYTSDVNHQTFGSSQIKSLFISGLLGIGMISVLAFAQSSSLLTGGLLIWVTISIGGFNYIKTRFQVQLMPAKIIWLTSAQALMAILFPLLFFQVYHGNALTLLLGVGISFLCIVLIIFGKNIKNLIQKQKSPIPQENSTSIIKKWFYFGSPLSIWFAMGLALPFFDRFFINLFQSGEELGMYAGIQELLTRIFSLTLFPLVLTLHPRIMNSWNKNESNVSIKIIVYSIGLMLGVGAILLLTIWIFNDFIFSMVQWAIPGLSSQFKDIILPLLLTGFLWQLSFFTHKMLELKEQTVRMVFFLFPSLLINLIGNIVFLPKYGVVATAYTALVSALIYCLITGCYTIAAIRKETIK